MFISTFDLKKNFGVRWTQTQIVGVQGVYADHLIHHHGQMPFNLGSRSYVPWTTNEERGSPGWALAVTMTRRLSSLTSPSTSSVIVTLATSRFCCNLIWDRRDSRKQRRQDIEAFKCPICFLRFTVRKLIPQLVRFPVRFWWIQRRIRRWKHYIDAETQWKSHRVNAAKIPVRKWLLLKVETAKIQSYMSIIP